MVDNRECPMSPNWLHGRREIVVLQSVTAAHDNSYSRFLSLCGSFGSVIPRGLLVEPRESSGSLTPIGPLSGPASDFIRSHMSRQYSYRHAGTRGHIQQLVEPQADTSNTRGAFCLAFFFSPPQSL